MSRGLGVPVALSILAHGGVVAAIAVLGAAWLLGSPPAKSPAALYVDLVHPVVATSDRHEAAGLPALRLRGARSRPSTPLPPLLDVAPPLDTPAAAPVARAVAPPIAPIVEPENPTSILPEVPPPPTTPVVPGPTVARLESGSVAEPARQRPSPAPLAAAPPPTGLGDDRLSTASSGSAAQRPSRELARETAREPGPAEPAGSLERGQPRRTAAAAPDPGRQPAAAAGGAGVARLPSGEVPGRTVPDGAIPPEYESYVRALRQRIQERLAYPWTAVRRGQQGVVELEMRVGADGRLVAVEVVAGVNADTLRTAAVAAVRGSAPFPFPPGLDARPLVIRLPVEFRLR